MILELVPSAFIFKTEFRIQDSGFSNRMAFYNFFLVLRYYEWVNRLVW